MANKNVIIGYIIIIKKLNIIWPDYGNNYMIKSYILSTLTFYSDFLSKVFILLLFVSLQSTFISISHLALSITTFLNLQSNLQN